MDTNTDYMALAKFAIGYTLFISAWNQCEASARRILQLLLGESDASMAVAVEMQNRSLLGALQTISKDKSHKEIRADLAHFCDGYNTLLSYRNYYVHGLMGVKAEKPEAVGIIVSVSAKNRLKIDHMPLTKAHLKDGLDHIHNLIGFAARIEKHLGATGPDVDNLIAAHGSSPEMPTWPEKLKKLPHYLQEP